MQILWLKNIYFFVCSCHRRLRMLIMSSRRLSTWTTMFYIDNLLVTFIHSSYSVIIPISNDLMLPSLVNFTLSLCPSRHFKSTHSCSKAKPRRVRHQRCQVTLSPGRSETLRIKERRGEGWIMEERWGEVKRSSKPPCNYFRSLTMSALG